MENVLGTCICANLALPTEEKNLHIKQKVIAYPHFIRKQERVERRGEGCGAHQHGIHQTIKFLWGKLSGELI